MSGGKSKCGYVNHGRSRPYYHRRCKPSLTNIESLPDELVFQILLEVPADNIYKVAGLVCKKWYNIIRNPSFIHEHLHRSNAGLVIQSYSNREHSSFLTMRRGRIEISKFSNYNFKCELLASFNGLILECDRKKDHAPHIANPSTNQRLALPRAYYSGVAYAASSMVYKVVNPYYLNDNPEERGCHILTVGVDKSWRTVHTQHLSLATRKVFVGNIPLTTDGFIHWTTRIRSACVLSLNVETEVIKEIRLPQGYKKRLEYYLSTGTSLTFLTNINQFSWEVWELRQETGEWTKLPKIQLESHILKSEYLKRRRSDPSLVPPNCSNLNFF